MKDDRLGPATGTGTQEDPAAGYNEAYFAFQRQIGEFSGWAELAKFADHISPTDRVVDFGCGGGYILKNILCAQKTGVEVNEEARKVARTVNGIATVSRVEDLPDNAADVVISNHALEHCAGPFAEVARLRHKLKPGGVFVCYVPHESIGHGWSPGDVNNHLYTWNPMTLGNLFASAGYEVVCVSAFYHIWPPFYRSIARLGHRVFHACSYVHGLLRRQDAQVKIVARRPAR